MKISVLFALLWSCMAPPAGAAVQPRQQAARPAADLAGAADVMGKLLQQVKESPNLPRDAARKLLEEAASVADAIIADPKREDRDYRVATFGKAMALELLAERVEQDRQRRLTLLAEARRLAAPIEELKKNPNPSAKPLTAKEAAALEWEYEDRWIWRLIDEGHHAAAVDGYKKYITTHPDFDPPIARLAEAYLKWADDATDRQTKVAAWQGALGPLQRLIGLAPNLEARSDAFMRVITVLGPRQLDRTSLQEEASRTMIQHYPMDAAAYYSLADVLLRTDRAADADTALSSARKVIRATAASRSSMAGRALDIVRAGLGLPPEAARRLFDEADALIIEAEKGWPNHPDVLAARGRWFFIKAGFFETDPAKKAALTKQGERLLTRAGDLREKKR